MLNSPLATPAATRAVLDAHGIDTRKALGQHFLVNDAIVGKICDLAEVSKGDTILEVGPGIGTLTCALLGCGASVVAVERDRRLLPVLAETCAGGQERLAVLCRDAVGIQAADLPSAPGKFVANLPYAVAATLVLDYFCELRSIAQATVMVQAEVAARMAARPGSKDYGAYTVKLALRARQGGLFKVGPANFYPPPRVDSAVIRLDRANPCGLSPCELAAASRMADAAFANRRKTLFNSCKAFFADDPATTAALPDLFSSCGVDAMRRGETLSLEEYAALGRALVAFGVAC